MMHKAWSSIEEVPYCIARSSVKFHGHTGGKNWRFESNLRLLGRSQLSNPSDLPCFVTSDKVTSENDCLITSRVKKIVIHGNKCIILFLTRYFMSWMHNSTQKQLLFADFAIVAKDTLFWPSIVTSPQLIYDVTQTCTSIVTSSSLIVLARSNWRKGDLHKWITTVNIDFSPPGIHGLACKKWGFIHT